MSEITGKTFTAAPRRTRSDALAFVVDKMMQRRYPRHWNKTWQTFESHNPSSYCRIVIQRDSAVLRKGNIWKTGDVGYRWTYTNEPLIRSNFILNQMVV